MVIADTNIGGTEAFSGPQLYRKVPAFRRQQGCESGEGGLLRLHVEIARLR